MNFADSVSTARKQIVRYPAACNCPVFGCVGKRRVEGLMPVTAACKKHGRQANGNYGPSDADYFVNGRVSRVH